MTRKLSEKQTAINPVRENFAPDWEALDRDTYASARKTSPVQPGDVVKFLDGTVQTGLVVSLCVMRLTDDSDPIPAYSVRVRRRDGQWANIWKRVFPGDIRRGCEAA